MIYVLGLVAIMAQSAAGLLGSLVFTRPLMADGFVGSLMRPYDINRVPKEGEVPEEDQPLVINATSTHDNEDDNCKDVILDDESPPEPAAAFSKESMAAEKIPRARKCNQKMYNVLSVEEAIIINKFARNTFFFKVTLLFVVGLTALIILVVARSNFSELVGDASQE